MPPLGSNQVRVRIRASGICHSDAHYRAGTSPTGPLPLTPGHEVAGVVEEVGPHTTVRQPGDRVCLHYLLSCGSCPPCRAGREQFCTQGAMIGKHTHGGYAEYIVVPEKNAIALPEHIPFEHGAVLMCSSATSYHALRKSRLTRGETVAIFGAGGLGISAIQIAQAMGAACVYAVDINNDKLALATKLGATAVDPADDAASTLRELTDGAGVDVALELSGVPHIVNQAVQSLATFGRLALVGISSANAEIDTYTAICKESEILGVSDHLSTELADLIEMTGKGLDLTHVATRSVPLEAQAVNDVLDELDAFSSAHVRTVIVQET